jgi:hypothetical protein
MKCPACGNEKLDYDSYKDMYRCGPCYKFFDPDEVGAPIFQLDKPEAL